MSVSETKYSTGLYRLAAVSSVAVGALLLAGAFGHFAAVWDRLTDATVSRLALLTPGVLLTLTGILNFVLVPTVWQARHWATVVALIANTLAAGYFALLLYSGVADHPIGLFLSITGAHALMLLSINLGLIWPISTADLR
ncbi:MAG: hypothetical protein AAGL69_01055 [Pseudomonadota bacterium]